ncbi:MAG: hypothetical protein KAJ75_04505 [Alphaproteobacteria bacterium]|nr:hypothetical protein [Alphaproteobacteria bacterium]
MKNKQWWQSKTLWANTLAIGTGIAANQCGVDVNGANSTAILGGLNILLRLFTAKKVIF